MVCLPFRQGRAQRTHGPDHAAPHPNPPHQGEGAAQHPVAVLTRPSPCGRGGGRGLGRIMFGIVGVNAVTATEALRLGAMKLPVTTPVVICEDW